VSLQLGHFWQIDWLIDLLIDRLTAVYSDAPAAQSICAWSIGRRCSAFIKWTKCNFAMAVPWLQQQHNHCPVYYQRYKVPSGVTPCCQSSRSVSDHFCCTVHIFTSSVITIAIRLRYDDTTTHSTTTELIEITICVRFDCDTTTTRLWRKIDMLIFCSRLLEAGARDTS